MTRIKMTAPMITEEEYQSVAKFMKFFIGQLNLIETGNGLYMNGEATCIEAFADALGMRLVLDLAKQEEHFDYDRFFRAYAKYYFCYEKGVSESGGGTHPHDYVRINFSDQHMDEFYETYPSVTEGTPMYIPPEDRLLLW